MVSIAAPTTLHAPIAMAALDAGVHVLSEKPMAENADKAASHGGGGGGATTAYLMSRSTIGGAATSRFSRRSSTPACWARSITPRSAGYAARASRGSAAGSPAARRPAADR